jgi:ABC-type enterochelin transport system ATPase subunit
MLDKWEKTLDLIAALKAATPFEAELTPPLIAHLRAERVAFELETRQIVREVSHAGDEGGILCHIEPEDGGKRLLVSLTHLRVDRSLPFSSAVLQYQKHRVKKLKKQRGV